MTTPPTEYMDGCTSFPDEIAGNDLTPCCDAHDVAYWNAETAAEKFTADAELFTCVANVGGEWYMFAIAIIMFVGVSTVGTYFWMNKDKKWKKDKTDETDSTTS